MIPTIFDPESEKYESPVDRGTATAKLVLLLVSIVACMLAVCFGSYLWR